jgi:hypothetical protein
VSGIESWKHVVRDPGLATTGKRANGAGARCTTVWAAPADVAAELLVSLDAPASDDPALVRSVWTQELERRARRMLSGEARRQ